MPKSKLPVGLGDDLTQSESAVQVPPKPKVPPAPKKPTKRKARRKSGAAGEAARIAAERYGLEKPSPKTPAERQRELRDRYVPVSVMLTPNQKAKLDATVALADTDLTNFIRDWIDGLDEPEPKG